MQYIAEYLAPCRVLSSAAFGLPPLASGSRRHLAWRGKHVLRQPIALESVTGDEAPGIGQSTLPEGVASNQVERKNCTHR